MLLACNFRPDSQTRAKARYPAVPSSTESVAEAVSRYDLTIEQVVEWYRVVGTIDSVVTSSGEGISLQFPLSERLSDQVRKVGDSKVVADIVLASGMTLEEFVVQTGAIQIVRLTIFQHDSLGDSGLFTNVGPGALRFGTQYRAVFDSLGRVLEQRKAPR